MKSTLLYAFYQMEELWKFVLGASLLLGIYVVFLVESTQSYQCLIGLSLQIPCIFTLMTAQRRLKQHQEGWNKYVHIIPVSRKKIIQSEFILFAIMTLISCCMILVLVLSVGIRGYLVTISDLGMLLGLTVFVSMNSQLFLFLLINQWKDKHTELCLVAAIFTTFSLLCVPYFLNKEYFFAQYHNNSSFGLQFFAITVCITGIITLFSYHIGYMFLRKREY